MSLRIFSTDFYHAHSFLNPFVEGETFSLAFEKKDNLEEENFYQKIKKLSEKLIFKDSDEFKLLKNEMRKEGKKGSENLKANIDRLNQTYLQQNGEKLFFEGSFKKLSSALNRVTHDAFLADSLKEKIFDSFKSKILKEALSTAYSIKDKVEQAQALVEIVKNVSSFELKKILSEKICTLLINSGKEEGVLIEDQTYFSIAKEINLFDLKGVFELTKQIKDPALKYKLLWMVLNNHPVASLKISDNFIKEIQDKKWKIKFLCRLGKLENQEDLKDDFFKQAYKQAQTFEGETEKVLAFCKIASQLSSTPLKEALCQEIFLIFSSLKAKVDQFSQSSQLSHFGHSSNLKKPLLSKNLPTFNFVKDQKDQETYDLVMHYLSLDLDLAFKLANLIQKEKKRKSAFLKISQQALTDPMREIKNSKSIEDSKNRIGILFELVKKTHSEYRKKVLKEIGFIVLSLPDDNYKFYVLCQMALFHPQTSFQQMILKNLEQAALPFSPSSTYPVFLSQIKNQIQSKNQVFNKILDEVNKNNKKDDIFYYEIVKAKIKMNLIDEAHFFINLIKNETYKDKVYYKMIEAVLSTHLEQALILLKEIRSDKYKEKALHQISHRKDLFVLNELNFQEILTLAFQMKQPSDQIKILCVFLKLIKQSDLKDLIFSELINLISRLTSKHDQLQALFFILPSLQMMSFKEKIYQKISFFLNYPEIGSLYKIKILSVMMELTGDRVLKKDLTNRSLVLFENMKDYQEKFKGWIEIVKRGEEVDPVYLEKTTLKLIKELKERENSKKVVFYYTQILAAFTCLKDFSYLNQKAIYK